MTAKSISQRTQTLAAVAMGRKSADMVIQNGQWVCVQSGEMIPGTAIAVKGRRVAYVGPDASHTIGESTRVIDAQGQYLVPGLLDAHMHIESGMVTITEFVRAVAGRGTTGMFIDPHEIANVFGLNGVRLMVDEAAVQPIHVWVQMPSCVPSAPGLETPGAVIGPREVARAMTWDGIVGLGEMMNFPGVSAGDEKMHAEMANTRRARKVIGGHYAALDLGRLFHGYVAGGPEDDHEGTRMEDAIARVRQGMKPMLRLGSGWHDVATQIRAITEKGLDPRHFILCTDDTHAETLVTQGHMDRVVRHAISRGLPPMTAIQMATLNTATHFGMARDVGMIAPGRYADILLVPDLPGFSVKTVIAKGRTIAEDGRLLIDLPPCSYPGWATHSVHLPRKITAPDFRLAASENGQYEAHVIGVVENQAPTRHLKLNVTASAGEVAADMKRDLAKIAVIPRHEGAGNDIQVGLVQGFGFTEPCAIGTTVAHDCHQMIVVGTRETDMAKAANKLAAVGGGQVVFRNGELIGLVELPIAGLMSNEPVPTVARNAASILEGFRLCGCRLNNPNMQLSLLALVVIPELRLSDKGLVDVSRFEFIPVLKRK
ncbi:MAG: adenine deaminase [Deltaproteobacteria bacterium]|nr:MAG: adenine deaminase [Deltaproteobacteria bacterium]